MKSKITIALNCMGGDEAPQMVVTGAEIAVERMPDIFFVLVGDETELCPLIKNSKHLTASNHKIIHTKNKVAAAYNPYLPLKSGKDTNMR